MNRFVGGTLVFVLLLSAGCVSLSSETGSYRTRLGSTTYTDAIELVREVLLVQYDYSFDREITKTEEVRFETNWKRHTPTSGEEAEGFSACRSKVFVTATPKTRRGGQVREYSVTFEAKYQARRSGGAWAIESIPEERKEFFDEMTELLKNEFKGGLRSL